MWLLEGKNKRQFYESWQIRILVKTEIPKYTVITVLTYIAADFLF